MCKSDNNAIFIVHAAAKIGGTKDLTKDEQAHMFLLLLHEDAFI